MGELVIKDISLEVVPNIGLKVEVGGTDPSQLRYSEELDQGGIQGLSDRI